MRLWHAAEAQDAVLGVEPHLATLRDALRDHHRDADPEVDVGAIGNVLRDSTRERFARPAERLRIGHGVLRSDRRGGSRAGGRRSRSAPSIG